MSRATKNPKKAHDNHIPNSNISEKMLMNIQVQLGSGLRGFEEFWDFGCRVQGFGQKVLAFWGWHLGCRVWCAGSCKEPHTAQMQKGPSNTGGFSLAPVHIEGCVVRPFPAYPHLTSISP